MKVEGWTCSAAKALAFSLVMPIALLAQGRVPAPQANHYQVIVIGTFGGPNSFVTDTGFVPGGVFLNNSGMLTGYADLSAPDPFLNFCFIDCFIDHAFLWQRGFITDLGVLPHGWSSAPVAISANGLIAGFAVNGEIDPLTPGFPEQRAVLWKDGRLFDLGTLPEGGYESEASSVNSRGQVVGTAFNTIPDPVGLNVFNDIFSPTQARAFLWQDGTMQDLGTLGGNDAAAFLINEKGQVMGWSYASTTTPGGCFPLVLGSFLWDQEHGMRNLGDFGGACTLAYDLNNRGQVVGFSVLEDGTSRGFLWQDGSLRDLGGVPGGNTTAFVVNEAGQAAGVGSAPEAAFFHALFWPKVGEAIDLGTIGTDPCSSAKAINNNGQVVGDSISLANCTTSLDASRAFLWQDGAIFDLNALIPPGSPLYLVHPQTINDRGEIAGFGVDADGNQHVFLLIPCDENHSGIEGCDYSLVESAPTAGTGPIQTTQKAILSAGQDRLPQAEIIARYRQLFANRHLRFARTPSLQNAVH
jgi:probable HAF family extracellular repeat protein